MKKLKICILSILTLFCLVTLAKAQAVTRAEVYRLLKAGTSAEIDAALDKIDASQLSPKEGFEGVLLMKRAGLAHLPKDKFKFFKQGRIKLETTIAQDKDNAELHFLRLIIGENAPKIVKYKANLETDKALVLKKFNELPHATQEAVKDYSKTSKVLRADEL